MMGLFRLSDLVLAVTLVVNAGAVLKYKLKRAPSAAADFGEVADDSSSVVAKLGNVLAALRTLRGLVAVWNVLVIFLMLVFFSA
ncbi:uncharacterized protein AMSG_06025 [Thecamonas trahens ATCC 50062]|uniref:Uncharacterized protein n=1 Tax=Thecamonas trahens ATCC 50062 TaxID=461836 RepID=A0A0L0DCD7_THETB|nr:hypothetical protein AMSG_06025 [Thecamonas trahens ATCC 50062]KNC49751.1 hypothetical protein AMSG_06025 [Thecamonas trahens ATCC 50062]|eukprot:XP_013757537.1 hypothetical protein AMSG_06025 [Thecamonas trahens ATCC 50062]